MCRFQRIQKADTAVSEWLVRMSDDPAPQPVCSWFQTGYCKFSELCPNVHVAEICDDVNCLKKKSKLRYPMPCRNQNDCRFGENCAYSHSGTTCKRLVDKLCDRMNDLEKQLEAVISPLIIPSKKKVDQIEQWAVKVTTEQDKCLVSEHFGQAYHSDGHLT